MYSPWNHNKKFTHRRKKKLTSNCVLSYSFLNARSSKESLAFSYMGVLRAPPIGSGLQIVWEKSGALSRSPTAKYVGSKRVTVRHVPFTAMLSPNCMRSKVSSEVESGQFGLLAQPKPHFVGSQKTVSILQNQSDFSFEDLALFALRI